MPKNPSGASVDDDWQDRYIAPEMQGFTKFYRFGHDIVVPVVVNDKATGNFILDTGAGLNSMSPRLAFAGHEGRGGWGIQDEGCQRQGK